MTKKNIYIFKNNNNNNRYCLQYLSQTRIYNVFNKLNKNLSHSLTIDLFIGESFYYIYLFFSLILCHYLVK